MRKITTIEVQERIDGLNGFGVLTLDISTYVNVRTKCRFIDKDHGEWWSKPNNVLNGHGHPKHGNFKKQRRLQNQLDRFIP